MIDYRNEDNELVFERENYDLDGLIRLVDSEEASMMLMYFDEDDRKYYRNRYDLLECERGIYYTLDKVTRYLEDEDNGLFIAFAATYDNRLTLFDGRAVKAEDANTGEVELGANLVYGMMIRQEEESIVVSEVLYHDGEEINQSWTEEVDDAGILTRELENLVIQFAD